MRIPGNVAHYANMDVKTKLLAGTIRQLRASRERIVRLIAKIPDHIDDHDLERYHLGMVKEEAKLAALEEHLLWCGPCVDRTGCFAIRGHRESRSVRQRRIFPLVMPTRAVST